ncbi:hypothetical protein EZJ19_15165 [Parasulfuritortus cantonensis]|uniref:Circularly permuted type 2 ATP-grasp protein n=1 Tax=Parasulfuritortus cantonensis TaxID=2528202 RepID=A0A4R1B1F8_9PROT|nr:hypothetical protein [Parasulfuritortus cantonensis]TCJ11611.1 hypothetical protein EZJ19_15165 [Parasulfuritortus cantonensis]
MMSAGPLSSLSVPAPETDFPALPANVHARARVPVSAREAATMAAVVRAVEAVVALPAYRAAVLVHAPASAGHESAASGVFLGFDFHLTPAGPRLIEINTNAGGALLHLARPDLDAGMRAAAEARFLAMFLAEWRSQRGDRPLAAVAIVDERPAAQFLYPEFVLFQRLFERHGIAAVIADPAELAWRDGALRHGDRRIDLVYNRLTDFGLDTSGHAALRRAYLEDAVVLTPHPRAHALYADKRNLILLGDRATLLGWGVDPALAELLATAIPATVALTPANAEALWETRRKWFFKPANGYGSKGVYRGDKLTKRVWGEIQAADYVAQAHVPPAEQVVSVAGQDVALKCDLRNYVYRGEVQLMAARLYQGQTTNVRTPGGGFALVDVAAGASA